MFQRKPKIEATPELVERFRALCAENAELVLVSLSTSDGFPIKSFAARSLNVEADKIAAMASTISSLGSSSSKEIFNVEVDVATIESSVGNILFVGTQYLDKECVLAVGANAAMSLASARFLTLRLAAQIKELKEL